jgi:hypothetical protein
MGRELQTFRRTYMYAHPRVLVGHCCSIFSFLCSVCSFTFCHCVLRFTTLDYLFLYNVPFFHANSILSQKQISKNIKPEMRCNIVFANYKFEQLKQHLSSSFIFSYRPVSNFIGATPHLNLEKAFNH